MEQKEKKANAALAALEALARALECGGETLRNAALTAVQHDESLLKELPEGLRRDRAFAHSVVEWNLSLLEKLPAELLHDRAFALEVIENRGWNEENVRHCVLQYLPYEMRNDREVLFAESFHNVNAFAAASDELQDDLDTVLHIVADYGFCLEWASARLRSDKRVVLAAVQQDGEALSNASEELRGDRDIVMAAVQQNGDALSWASEELQGDRDLVMAAIQQNGNALGLAPEELRGDMDVVREACLVQNGGLQALAFASKRIRRIPRRNRLACPSRLAALFALEKKGLPVEVRELVVVAAGLWEVPLPGQKEEHERTPTEMGMESDSESESD